MASAVILRQYLGTKVLAIFRDKSIGNTVCNTFMKKVLPIVGYCNTKSIAILTSLTSSVYEFLPRIDARHLAVMRYALAVILFARQD